MPGGKVGDLVTVLQSCIKQQTEFLNSIQNLGREDNELSAELNEQLESFRGLQQSLADNQICMLELIKKQNEEILDSSEVEVEDDKNEESDATSSSDNWCSVVECEWTEERSGGCMNHLTWRNNPQVLLHVEQEAEITITLTQKPDNGETEGVGFYVFNGLNYKELITTNGSAVARSSFSKNEEVSCTFSLAPNPNGYVILPCTFHPNIQMKFSISIESGEAKNTIREITDKDRYKKNALSVSFSFFFFFCFREF